MPIRRRELIEVREGVAWFRVVPAQQVLLPREFYLRQVAGIDLDDEEQVGAFLQRWGFLSLSGNAVSRKTVHAWSPDWLGTYALGWLYGTSATPNLRVDWQRRVEETETARPHKLSIFELLDETRLGLAWIRDLTRLWQQYQRDHLETVPDVWESAMFGIRRPEPGQQAVTALTTGVNGALTSYSPHLLPATEDGPDWDEEFLEPALESPRLHSVIVAQLYNNIVENAVYRICRNETCGHTFVRQIEGQARFEQYRTVGVLYCTSACARAQASQEYRRRKKAASRTATTERGSR